MTIGWLAGCVAPTAAPDAGPPDAQMAPALMPTSEPRAGPSLRLPRETREDERHEDELAARYPAYGVAMHYMASIFERADTSSRVIGYMRRGAQFRAGEEVSRKGCAGGFFEVWGGGYVCHGGGVWIGSQPRSLEDTPIAPSIDDPMPYRYRRVVGRAVPLYGRLPDLVDEQRVTQAISALEHDAGAPDASVADAGTSDPSLPEGVRAVLEPGFYLSVSETLETSAGRAFERTVRGGYVRSSELGDAALPEGKGVALGGRYRLPLAFVYRGGAPALSLDPVSGALEKQSDALPLYSAHQLTGETVARGGRTYFVTREGLLIRDTAVRVIRRAERPSLLRASERWIRVDLTQQTLTAYEGDEPVFATLVSSGIVDHPTPTGLFRLHAKHVSATMADNLASDGAYRIEDVPWTMYFQGSYALHAAFWHDRFGRPRSHGCVNLAPRDARWLFFFSRPNLPSAWHGVLADVGEGTAIAIEGAPPAS